MPIVSIKTIMPSVVMLIIMTLRAMAAPKLQTPIVPSTKCTITYETASLIENDDLVIY